MFLSRNPLDLLMLKPKKLDDEVYCSHVILFLQLNKMEFHFQFQGSGFMPSAIYINRHVLLNKCFALYHVEDRNVYIMKFY